MSVPVFGQDAPPPPAAERMAYVARARRCGHIRALQVDNRPGAVDDFVARGVTGLVLERIPAKRAIAEGIQDCASCRTPIQPALFDEAPA